MQHRRATESSRCAATAACGWNRPRGGKAVTTLLQKRCGFITTYDNEMPRAGRLGFSLGGTPAGRDHHDCTYATPASHRELEMCGNGCVRVEPSSRGKSRHHLVTKRMWFRNDLR